VECDRYDDCAKQDHMFNKYPIFNGAGRLTALGGIDTDITEHKLVEEEIRQLNKKLERRTVQLTAANTDLESFSYSVAHDLRAPLRHVLGYAEILVEDHSDELSSAARRCLEKVSRNARQMAQLVDDLLTLAHIGRQRVTRTRTDLHALVLGVLEELAPTCAGRDIKWRIGELPSLDCDPSLMRQVYLDLLSNAIKYTIGRHPAVIEVGTNEVDAEQVLFVRDNGVGFDMKYVDKIFGVFQRLHSPEDFEGTGVGLAIVDRIIRKHGGRVWAQSEPGQGATFYFRI